MGIFFIVHRNIKLPPNLNYFHEHNNTILIIFGSLTGERVT
jgi:hypothetical protein